MRVTPVRGFNGDHAGVVGWPSFDCIPATVGDTKALTNVRSATPALVAPS